MLQFIVTNLLSGKIPEPVSGPPGIPALRARVEMDSQMLLDERASLVHSEVPGLHFKRLRETVRQWQHEPCDEKFSQWLFANIISCTEFHVL